MDAFADHGEVSGDTVTGDVRRRPAGHRPASASVGIDYDDVIASLEHEGVEKFEESWDELLETVEGQLEAARSDATAGRGRRHVGRGADAASATSSVRRALVERRRSPAGWLAQDPTLWGPDAEAEAAKRLGWVDLPEHVAAAARRARGAARRAARARASTTSCSAAWAARRWRPR